MKFKFPTPYTVLFIVVIICAIATWLVPSGEYQKLQYDKQNDKFIVSINKILNTVKNSDAEHARLRGCVF